MKPATVGWSTMAVTLMIGAIAGCTQPEPTKPEATANPSPAPASEPAAEAEAAPTGEGDLPADAAILQTVYDQVERLNLCDGFWQPEVAETESRVYPSSATDSGPTALVEVVCAQAAYQEVYAYAAYQLDGTVRPLPLDGFYPDEAGTFVRSSEPTVGGLASFDPDSATLTIFSKARGLGDCGALAAYRWTGTQLDLATYRYQACSDSTETVVEPADYPQIYP